MKDKAPTQKGNYDQRRSYEPTSGLSAGRNLITSTTATPAGNCVARLRRAWLLLILAGVASASFSGCIWVHDHDHDHDRDHLDHHDEHHDEHP